MQTSCCFSPHLTRAQGPSFWGGLFPKEAEVRRGPLGLGAKVCYPFGKLRSTKNPVNCPRLSFQSCRLAGSTSIGIVQLINEREDCMYINPPTQSSRCRPGSMRRPQPCAAHARPTTRARRLVAGRPARRLLSDRCTSCRLEHVKGKCCCRFRTYQVLKKDCPRLCTAMAAESDHLFMPRRCWVET